MVDDKKTTNPLVVIFSVMFALSFLAMAGGAAAALFTDIGPSDDSLLSMVGFTAAVGCLLMAANALDQGDA